MNILSSNGYISYKFRSPHGVEVLWTRSSWQLRQNCVSITSRCRGIMNKTGVKIHDTSAFRSPHGVEVLWTYKWSELFIRPNTVSITSRCRGIMNLCCQGMIIISFRSPHGVEVLWTKIVSQPDEVNILFRSPHGVEVLWTYQERKAVIEAESFDHLTV